MPLENDDGIVKVPEERKTQTTEQELTLLLQKAVGGEMPNLSSKQVDEVLSQRRQITNYIHEDRKRDSYDNKFIFLGVLVFILLFSALVLWRKPDIFSEVLALIIGLLGGGAGGYGIGKSRQ